MTDPNIPDMSDPFVQQHRQSVKAAMLDKRKRMLKHIMDGIPRKKLEELATCASPWACTRAELITRMLDDMNDDVFQAVLSICLENLHVTNPGYFTSTIED